MRFADVNNVVDLPPASSAAQLQYRFTGYSGYVLFVLVLIQTMGFVDRQLMTILVEPIKREFAVSDTAMGLLSGMAFVLFYVTLSIPIARLADRRSRRNILSIAVSLWSVATYLCGAAGSFAHLALARIGVGIGEAGGSPPAQSLLADYFPPRLRSTALGIYATGAHLGNLLSLVGGAVIASHYGWRMAFYALGLPGLLLALLIWRTVEEPQRGRWDPPAPPAAAISIAAVLRAFWSNTAIRTTALAASLTALSGFGASTWLPSFAMRVHGLSLIETGMILGISATAGGFAGAICGGVLTDWSARRDPRWQLRVAAIGGLISVPLQLLVMLWPAQQFLHWGDLRIPIALSFMPLSAFFSSFWFGPAYAAVHNLVQPGERAQMSACMMLLLNILGAGGGPLLVGSLSDVLTPIFGDQAIRYAIVLGLLSAVAGVALFWRAGALYRTALRAQA
jgi:MFS family permease